MRDGVKSFGEVQDRHIDLVTLVLFFKGVLELLSAMFCMSSPI